MCLGAWAPCALARGPRERDVKTTSTYREQVREAQSRVGVDTMLGTMVACDSNAQAGHAMAVVALAVAAYASVAFGRDRCEVTRLIACLRAPDNSSSNGIDAVERPIHLWEAHERGQGSSESRRAHGRMHSAAQGARVSAWVRGCRHTLASIDEAVESTRPTPLRRPP